MKYNKKSAFSLLEMMFVMVVIASILLFVVITMRNRAEDKLITRTAIEMQTLLQAAANYYTGEQSKILNDWTIAQYYQNNVPTMAANSKFWPSDLSALVGKYIQSEQLCSVWPSTAATICANRASFVGAPAAAGSVSTNQNYYTVSLTVPDPALAVKIATRVPMSSVQDNTIQAYIPAPGIQYYPAQYKNRGWITSAGALTGSSNMSPALDSNSQAYTIYMPNCPTGYEGHYILSYLKQRTGHCYRNKKLGSTSIGSFAQIYHFSFESGYQGVPNGQQEIQASIANREDTTIVPTTGLDPCTPRGTVSAGAGLRDPGYKILYYTTFCIPAGQWQVKTSYCTDDGYLNDKTAQCSSNWNNYNAQGGKPCQQATTSNRYH